MNKITVLGVAVLLCAPVVASARGPLSLGPRVGYYKAPDADEGKLFAGGAARLRFGPGLAIEGSVDYRREEYQRGQMTLTSWPVMVTGLIYPLPILYGVIGAGWHNLKVEYEPVALPHASVQQRKEQKFGWHFGVGVDLPLGKNAHLAGDVRYVFIDYDFSAVPGSEEMKADFYAITLGLLFRL
ncbi:MAG: porin family protein [candidate division KSB1 bacterium]|nr:porin family protein [candidate division KSB1 bacterium]MDZ7293904.1 porin family protein [candidate division KSB1 bacterium]MDZ7378011.1 porin family protein [candidate division KSB1 bacterium]MDZ7384696.1 porin family protein [candidate division KSB1 bacterium]MDZ7392265.1 porin family protein [candidate division KSB1 bacterium]